MKVALDELFKTHPQLSDQPEEKLMKFIFKYLSLPSIDVVRYKELHPTPIVETNIDIDVPQFTEEIKKYDNYFKSWGDEHKEFPREGIPLVNYTGELEVENDISTMPLDEHFAKHQKMDAIILDNQVKVKTEVASLPSLEPLMSVFGDYMIRSAILKWGVMGHFKPHVDVKLPAPNLRLWGTTSNNMQLKMDGKIINNIKPGKIYIFDSSLVHEAHATGNDVYQFFIGLNIDAYDTMMSRRI